MKRAGEVLLASTRQRLRLGLLALQRGKGAAPPSAHLTAKRA